MNAQNIGKKITQLRQEQSLTQQQLAAMLNVSHQAVSKWESGLSLPDMGTLLELTRIFGMTVEQLAGDDDAAERTQAPDASAEPVKEEAGNDKNEEKEAENMNIMQLIRMAPFMSKDTVAEIAMQIETQITAVQLARLAPYVSAECLEALLEKHTPELTWDTLRRLAPFLRREYVDRIAKEIAGGTRNVSTSNEDINRAFNELGKAFDGLGKDMGKAIDELGRGVEKTVRKAIRFGGKVVNEMSSAINDLANDAGDASSEKSRSERAAAIRKKAFERALEDGNWDWLGKHMDEIRGDIDLTARIAEKAKAAGLHDWICQYLGGYADEFTIEAAIRGGKWSWLGDNCWQFDEAVQQKIALAAMNAENWQWLSTYSDQMKLDGCAFEIAERAMRSGETLLAANVATMHLDAAGKNELMRAAYTAGNTASLDEMLDLADDDFKRWMLLDLADKGKWESVEKYADEASSVILEEVCEKAVEQGNFDAIDMLDRYM